MKLNELRDKVFAYAEKQGFHENINFGEKLMLIVSELSEALEADRNRRWCGNPYLFFIVISFNNDFSSISFFVRFPLFIRIPLFIALAVSFFPLFKTHDHKHVFLAVFLNLVFVFLFFEINFFKSFRNPFVLLPELFSAVCDNIVFFFKEYLWTF